MWEQSDLGVLKARRVDFAPLLPIPKIRAIQRLGVGFLEKVSLGFDEPFWQEGGKTHLFYASSTPGEARRRAEEAARRRPGGVTPPAGCNPAEHQALEGAYRKAQADYAAANAFLISHFNPSDPALSEPPPSLIRVQPQPRDGVRIDLIGSRSTLTTLQGMLAAVV